MEDNIVNNIQPTENSEPTIENKENSDSSIEILNEIPKPKPMDENERYAKRSHKSTKEIELRTRAINNFRNGVDDPEFKVSILPNGNYRVAKRKVPLDIGPINVNQIPENKPSSIEQQKEIPTTKPQKQNSEHNPFNEIVYYNLTNQVNEQLNKRLDSITAEIERLRNKNTKLKGKYKSLKQAIFVSDDEEENEIPIVKPTEVIEEQEIPQQQQQIQQPQYIRRTNGINFNKFFN